ncbi:MAG TPA: tetratricopeptide repeat protein, partial [Methylomirabilota bacterium]|nr:tetratricopeptide repeat protein [Methylomirabilota bacterium]
MADARIRSPIRALALPLLLWTVSGAIGCQRAMSVEEAKKVTAEFTGASFVPPPRTINDITAILDQQQRANPEALARAQERADTAPPQTEDPVALARFYYRRGLAARRDGRARQAIEDLARAAEYAERAPRRLGLEPDILHALYAAEIHGGNQKRGMAALERAIAKIPPNRRALLIQYNSELVKQYVSLGRTDAAQRALLDLLAVRDEARAWSGAPENLARWDAWTAQAQAVMMEGRGRLPEAEKFWRESIAAISRTSATVKSDLVEFNTSRLAWALALQGRLLEAEAEARKALIGSLSKYGRYSTPTANAVRWLAQILISQGRYEEAERLARANIEILEKTGATEGESVVASHPRRNLAAALVYQERWAEALGEYDVLKREMTDPEQARSLRIDRAYPFALINSGRPREAARMLEGVVQSRRKNLGDDSPSTADSRAMLGMARAAQGDRERALEDLTASVPVLLRRTSDTDDETGGRAVADLRLGWILTAYIGLLADI